MSDENQTPPEAPVPDPEPTPYLTRAKVLPVEGVVYCLSHGAVHDDTTDPYGYGEADCKKSEHRSVLYRARKGDIDETTEPAAGARVIAAASGEALAKEERELVVWLTGQAEDTTADVADSLRRIFGDDDSEVLAEVDQRLTLLTNVRRKLGGGEQR